MEKPKELFDQSSTMYYIENYRLWSSVCWGSQAVGSPAPPMLGARWTQVSHVICIGNLGTNVRTASPDQR